MKRADFKPKTGAAGKFSYKPNLSYDARALERKLEKEARELGHAENVSETDVFAFFVDFETGEFWKHTLHFPIDTVRCYRNATYQGCTIYQRFKRVNYNILAYQQILKFHPSPERWERAKKMLLSGIIPKDANSLKLYSEIDDRVRWIGKTEMIEVLDFYEFRSGSYYPENLFIEELENFIHHINK